jgi:F0F1-type ATP synthase membrane subunit b/b'
MSDESSRRISDGALAELIAVEKRAEQELVSAMAEAERIVDAARRDAESCRQAEDSALNGQLADLRASMERECEGTIRTIEESTRAEAERYARVDGAELLELARFVIERLVGSRVQA